MKSGNWLLVLLLLGGISGLILLLIWQFPGRLSDRGSQIHLTYATVLVCVIAGSALANRRLKAGHMLRYAFWWLLIGTGVFAVYSFRDEASAVKDRLLGELMPHRAQIVGGNVVLRMSNNGHFVVEALVDGTKVTFLVDTGASDVVLSPNDAKRLGFDESTLKFTKIYQTANGIIRGAPVRLGRVAIGSLSIANVRASVNGAPMNESLLGMSYLERLSGFEVTGNSLILKP